MDCSEFKNRIFAFSEGRLSEELNLSAHHHLTSCVACARLASEFKKLETLIEKEKATELTPFVTTRILQRLENEFKAPKGSNSRVWIRILQPVAIAGALLCGIIIGSYTAKKDISTKYQLTTTSENIEFLRSNLFITDFADEDKILVINK